MVEGYYIDLPLYQQVRSVGHLTVITVRTGAGKTTLLRALLGLVPADAGDITWSEGRVRDTGAFFAPPRSAYTPQVPRLFSDTLRENILLGMEDDGIALAVAVHDAVLEQDLQTLEHGLDTPIGPRGVRLSGGRCSAWPRRACTYVDPSSSSSTTWTSVLDTETERLLWERL